MIAPFANAPAPLSADFNVQLVLICAGILIVVALLTTVPIALARHHRYRETIIAILILWSLATAGSISYQVMQQMNWSAEHDRRINSGYYDPQDISDQPKSPILLWTGLGIIYCTTTAWSLRRPN